MQQGKPDTPIVYAVFDLLELDGVSILDRPLTERRELLEELLDATEDDPDLGRVRRRRRAVRGGARASPRGRDGQAPWVALPRGQAQPRLAEGQDARPRGVRHLRLDEGAGERAGRFGSLVLGTYRGKELHWIGNCGTGFTERDIDELLTKLEPLRRDTCPFPVEPKMPKIRKGDVVWVEPKLVCEVEFAEWTHDGHLRAPSFQGLREDKPAQAVRREQPVEKSEGRVKLSNLDKVFWPDEGITKGDLLDYYRAVAPVILPHLRDARSRCAATPTGSPARRSSRRMRRRTCRSGSRGSASRCRRGKSRASAGGSRRRS